MPQIEGWLSAASAVLEALPLGHYEADARLRRLRHVEIPPSLNASAIPGISREVAEALGRERPRTLADAERVPGMTPAALALLAGRLARRKGSR